MAKQEREKERPSVVDGALVERAARVGRMARGRCKVIPSCSNLASSTTGPFSGAGERRTTSFDKATPTCYLCAFYTSNTTTIHDDVKGDQDAIANTNRDTLDHPAVLRHCS